MLRFNVVTPERAFLDEDCLSVTLPGSLGEMQILEGHTPCLLQLETGHVVFENKDRVSTRFMIAAGFVEVEHNSVNVLCEMARYKEEVDRTAEQCVKEGLEAEIEKLASKNGEEHKRLSAELERSVARLSLLD